jgi:rRNA maturation RNase YbeY
LLAFSGLQDKDLSLLFVDNKKITVLNKRFFRKNNPTNVISFSYLHGLPSEVLGDIIISVERAEEEARASGTPFYERLLALIVHGLAHVMGYDHEKGGVESRRMHYRERRFMDLVRAHEEYQKLVSEHKTAGHVH